MPQPISPILILSLALTLMFDLIKLEGVWLFALAVFPKANKATDPPMFFRKLRRLFCIA
jgi:hypothetical protein